MDLDAEMMRLKNQVAPVAALLQAHPDASDVFSTIKELAPVLRALAGDPALLARIASDSSSSAQATARLMEKVQALSNDVVELSGRIATVEGVALPKSATAATAKPPVDEKPPEQPAEETEEQAAIDDVKKALHLPG